MGILSPVDPIFLFGGECKKDSFLLLGDSFTHRVVSFLQLPKQKKRTLSAVKGSTRGGSYPEGYLPSATARSGCCRSQPGKGRERGSQCVLPEGRVKDLYSRFDLRVEG